jgi:hypothetical protein
MPYYKTTFYRSSFSFGDKVEQTFDVVFFRKENKYTEEKYNVFRNAALEALKKQAPKFPEQSGLPLDAGWSSTMETGKYVKLNIPWLNWKIQKPAPGKPVISCGYTTKEKDFSGNFRSYRATRFYTLKKKTPIADARLAKIFPELIEPRWYVIPCNPKDAIIVSGAGVAGNLSLISEIEVGDLVPWSDIMLKEEQYKHSQFVIEYEKNPDHFDFMTGRDIARHYLKEWLEKLGWA